MINYKKHLIKYLRNNELRKENVIEVDLLSMDFFIFYLFVLFSKFWIFN